MSPGSRAPAIPNEAGDTPKALLVNAKTARESARHNFP